jgi:hypothetical protein
MQANRRSEHRHLLVLALLAAAACSDHTQIANPLTPGSGNRATAAPPAGGKVKVKQFQLSSNTLSIEGPTVAGNASIANSGAPIDNVALRGEILQGTATRVAVTAQLTCAGTPGTLPSGNCNMSFSAAASNSTSGTGTLVAGAAVFELDVVQDPAGAATVLATKSLNVNLVGAVAITSLTLESTTLTIEGAGVNYTATISNPASTLNNVVMQGEILQSGVVRAAGGAVVSCGSALGVLPPGTCTFAFTAAASNSNSGNGTLVPGPATFQLQLLESGATTTVLDTKTVAVTLVVPEPTITNVTLSTTTLMIGGPPMYYTATVNNPTSNTISDVFVQANLFQGGVLVASGGTFVECGAGDGVFTPGTCSASGQFAIGSNFPGITPGAATLQIRLFQSGAFSVDFDFKTFPVTIVAAPSITSLQLESTTIAIESFTNYTVTVNNPTSSNLSTVLVQGEMIQGATDRAAGGTNVVCGAGSGVLPPGACTFQGDAVASNGNSGNGTLVSGAATFRLFLYVFDGTTTTQVDVKDVAVTLTTP